MHNKFIVVDGRTVETESFNFTAVAQRRNAENVTVLWDHRDAAVRYEAEFQRLWQESRDYPAGEAP